VVLFGAEGRDAMGRVDIPRLGDVVFENEQARAKLNGILHPLIGAAGAQHIANLQDNPAPYILYEAALLVETGSYKAFLALVVVSADEAVQKARLLERDGITGEEADARIASQLPLTEKTAVADHVVVNDGDLAATRSQVAAVHEKLVSRFTQEGST
jgi:dephospho-CoA kinase